MAVVLVGSQFADFGDVGRYYRWGVSGDEDGFGVPGGKLFASFGGAGLEEEGRSLRGGLAYVWSGDAEVFAYVVDGSDAAGVGVDASVDVANYGIVSPGGFEEFVHYF